MGCYIKLVLLRTELLGPTTNYKANRNKIATRGKNCYIKADRRNMLKVVKDCSLTLLMLSNLPLKANVVCLTVDV